MSIDVRHVSKRFGDFAALTDIDLHVATGELVALLGPSGAARRRCCGSSPGWRRPTKAQSCWRAKMPRPSRATTRRGFVFQHYALFRHMTVFDNVAFGLQVRPRRLRPRRPRSARKS